MAKVKEYKYLSSRSKDAVRLKDLDKDTLLKKIKEIEEYDKVKYRKTCGHYQKTWRKIQKEVSDMFVISSSDESVEYESLQPYRPGSLGLIKSRERKRRFPRLVPAKKPVPQETGFDWLSAVILSDLGILNKFEKKKDEYVKSAPTIKEKRRYYVP